MVAAERERGWFFRGFRCDAAAAHPVHLRFSQCFCMFLEVVRSVHHKTLAVAMRVLR